MGTDAFCYGCAAARGENPDQQSSTLDVRQLNVGSSVRRRSGVNAAEPVFTVWSGADRLSSMALTRHCWKCGTEYKLPGGPGRSETCHTCGSDLKVCLNCVSYDRRVAHQCRDGRADPVAEKHLANYCEYFEMIRREYAPPAGDQSRENKARESLKKLLGD